MLIVFDGEREIMRLTHAEVRERAVVLDVEFSGITEEECRRMAEMDPREERVRNAATRALEVVRRFVG